MKNAKQKSIADRISAALNARDWSLLTQLCRQTLRKDGADLVAHRLLGFSLNEQRDTDGALTAYRQAVARWPNDAELLINYANVLLKHARNSEALPLLEKVCELRPQHAMGWIKLAQCCYESQANEKGFQAAEMAAALAKTEEEQRSALTQKAIHRRELGQVHQAVLDSEAAIALCPYDNANHTNRLLFMLADPQVDAAQVAAAAFEFAAVFEAPLKPQWPTFEAQAKGDPWKRLKVGFLSPDFRMHSVMYFVEGLLAQLDRRQFEIFAFYLFPKDDYITTRVQRHADHFIRLSGMSAQAQAEAIRSHEIDILIDLAGHTGHNGLLALAHKAAPVQVSWLGYPATTGLSATDYKFTDEVTDPADADSQYSERLYRMPTLFVCYRPMSRNPLWRYQPSYLVRPTPALSNGYITFGSCNNLGKLTDEVLTLWGRLLHSIPNARLLIEGKNLEKPDFVRGYQQRCARLGIDTERLDLVPLDIANQYLTYHRIDIALDPFPLTGGTTTFDVLWMGVPIVSMIGQSFKSRMGVGMLSYLGRTEWLANDTAQYLHIAQGLATDVERLNTLRLGLRAELEQSVLMREDLFNQHFADGLRSMWVQWLIQRSHPGDALAQSHTIQKWLENAPTEWSTPATPGVGLEPGQRVSLQEAHQRLQKLVDVAKAQVPSATTANGMIENKQWAAVTELAETVLSAVPHDPMALACLAEVEQAHGHTEFAMTYLRYATQSMAAPLSEADAPERATPAAQQTNDLDSAQSGSTDAEACFSLGNALREDGQMQQAINCYRETLRINPAHVGGAVNLGLALWDTGEFAAATEFLAIGAQLIPPGARRATKLQCQVLSLAFEADNSQPFWGGVRSYLLKQCTTEEQIEFLSLCRFRMRSPEIHKMNIFNKLVVPLLKAALVQGNFTHAMKLHDLSLVTIARSPSTQERWAWYFDRVNPLFVQAGENYRKRLPKLPYQVHQTRRPVVAFIVDFSVSIGSGLDLLLMILEQMSPTRASQSYIAPVVYTLVQAPTTLISKCNAWGITVIDFCAPRSQHHAKDDLTDKLLAIRQQSQLDGVSVAALFSTYEGIVCLATSIGIAPRHIFLSMGFTSIAAPRLDAYFAFVSLSKGVKMIDNRPWRTLPIPFLNSFAADDSPEGHAQIAEITATRARLHANHSTILGTLARTEKLSEEFFDAVAVILRKNPTAAFLWFGKEPGPVTSWVDARDIADRCFFAGWVDTKIYSRVLDVHLDCFGLPTGLTMMESFSAGSAYVLRRGVESANLGMTSILCSISDETIDPNLSHEARRIFQDPETGNNLMMLADTTEQYIGYATRLIQDVGFRHKVGAAAKRFMHTYFHESNHMGKIFGEHIADIVANADNPILADTD